LGTLVACGSAGAGGSGPVARAAALPTIGGCKVFPASNAINRDYSRAPVDPHSSQYIAAIARSGRFLHPDFGGHGEYGIPFVVVPAVQKLVPIRYDEYGDESDRGPFPIPLNAPVEGGASSDGDRHVLAVQRGKCKLFELWHARRSGRGWVAGSGAKWDLRSNRGRRRGWTSADAAGLPIVPLLARYTEAARGVISHAIRITVEDTQNGYVAPATHFASSKTDRSLPPMGLRLRLKASFSLGGFHGQALAILKAAKRYGFIIADNGSSVFISGDGDPRWDDDDLGQLKSVPITAFEAIKHGRITRTYD
jgi:hypothetical protein